MTELAADVVAELSALDEFVSRCDRLNVDEGAGLTLDTAAELFGSMT